MAGFQHLSPETTRVVTHSGMTVCVCVEVVCVGCSRNSESDRMYQVSNSLKPSTVTLLLYSVTCFYFEKVSAG